MTKCPPIPTNDEALELAGLITRQLGEAEEGRRLPDDMPVKEVKRLLDWVRYRAMQRTGRGEQ